MTTLLLAAMVTLAQDSSDSGGWLDQGRRQFQAGQYREAAASLEQAVAKDPASLMARVFLASAYLRLYLPDPDGPVNSQEARSGDKAEQHFQRALELNPKQTVALSSMGLLKLKQGKLPDAQDWYEKLAAIQPRDAGALYHLGMVAWKRLDEARMVARAKAGMGARDPGPIADAAVRQSLKTEYGPVADSGLRALNQALTIEPESEQTMTQLALLLRARADLRDSKAEYLQDVGLADQWEDRIKETQRMKAERAPTATVPTPPLHAAPARIPMDAAMMEGKLTHRVTPVSSGLHGMVVLDVVIDRQGMVIEAKGVSGPPELMQAAVDAVRQWTYAPVLVKGAPVEVTTQVSVEFP